MSADDDAATRIDTAGRTRGDRRLVFAGGFALIAALLGYLVVRGLVAGGTLAAGSEVLALPVFGLLGVTGFVLFVASFLTE